MVTCDHFQCQQNVDIIREREYVLWNKDYTIYYFCDFNCFQEYLEDREEDTEEEEEEEE